MLPALPPEILDLIVDNLYDEPTTLQTCCLVSKSWVHRTRKHLFASVTFQAVSPGAGVDEWKKTFPNPTNSPAHHIRTLSIRRSYLAEAVHWGTISTFCRVVRLDVHTDTCADEWIPLAPLHGLFPALRSLRLSFTALPDSEIFDLICSFPCLEDLALESFGYGRGGRWNASSTPPRLTGSLELRGIAEGIQSITRRLFDFPNGLHFTAIKVAWDTEPDVRSTMDLVSRCSDTLQFLDIMNYLGEFPSISVPD